MKIVLSTLVVGLSISDYTKKTDNYIQFFLKSSTLVHCYVSVLVYTDMDSSLKDENSV